jgi:hypothetical protein
VSRCKHKNTDTGEMHGFTEGVAVRHLTQQNPAAHGGVTYRRTCLDCGATRRENSNGREKEYGPWRKAEVTK